MNDIPSAEAIAERLATLSYRQLGELARRSGVSFHTLLKIRGGDTDNPRIKTVVKFWPHIEAAQRLAA